MDASVIKRILEVSEVGRDTLGNLIKKSDDSGFRSVMADEFAKFQDITRNTMEYAAKNNISFKSSKKFRANPLSNFRLGTLSIKKTPEYMAEMLVVSNIIALIDIKKALKECGEANEDVKALAYSLTDVLNSNIQEMLSFV